MISLVQVIPQMFIAYFNMNVLIPRYFMKKRYLEYFLGVLICFLLLFLFYEYVLTWLVQLSGQPPPGRGPRHWSRGNGPEGMRREFFNPYRRMRFIYLFTQTLAIYFLSTAFKTSQFALKKEKEASELKSENLNSELKFLRSQINPHFLFNALNNIYSLSVLKSEDTPKNILKLSEMLRYIIYDCNAEKVALEKEINYINNYIDLQKLKDDQIQSIAVDFEHVDPKKLISPMILIPFVENSFKHSKIEDIENGWIKMKMETKGEELIFQISNSVPELTHSKDSIGGVGLENVRRRLELLYPDRFELQIDEESNSFSVKLNIILH